MKILPAITTIFDWRGKIKEAKELGLNEVALFLTAVNFGQRREIFALLKDTKIKKIPFVHIRQDSASDEMDYLIKKYHKKYFGKFAALEMENRLREQLRARDYILKLYL